MNKFAKLGVYSLLLAASSFDVGSTETSWQIGGLMHFEEQSGSDYVGTIELNEIIREVIRKHFDIATDNCMKNAKPLIKKEGNDFIITHREQSSEPGVGEEMHATLFYTKKRCYTQSEDWHETLKDNAENLAEVDASMPTEKAPTVDLVSKAYHKIIKPDWKFEITKVSFVGGAILGFVSHNGKNEILNQNGHPVSEKGLHITLLSVDSSVSKEAEKLKQVTEILDKELRGKTIKVGNRNGYADLEFGISGSKPSDRIRPALK